MSSAEATVHIKSSNPCKVPEAMLGIWGVSERELWLGAPPWPSRTCLLHFLFRPRSQITAVCGWLLSQNRLFVPQAYVTLSYAGAGGAVGTMESRTQGPGTGQGSGPREGLPFGMGEVGEQPRERLDSSEHRHLGRGDVTARLF